MDLQNTTRVLRALPAVNRATNVVTAGDIIDLQDFGSVMFVIMSGTISDGSFDVAIEHGNDPTLSDATTAATVDEIIGQAPSFSATDDDVVKRISYRRLKRYCRLSVTQTGAVSGGVLGAIAVLGNPRIAPVT